MKLKNQRGSKACAAVLLTASFVLILCSLALYSQANWIFCKEVFPECTVGACFAKPDWRAVWPCVIWCDINDPYTLLMCEVPPPR